MVCTLSEHTGRGLAGFVCLRLCEKEDVFHVYKIGFQARWQNCEKRLCLSVYLSAWNKSAPTGRNSVKFLYLNVCRKTV